MNEKPAAVLLAVLLALSGLPGSPAAGDEPSSSARQRRRTPVVDVFEATRDAVVSISSTERVVLRSRSPFDSFFDEFFDMPSPRMRQSERNVVGSGFVIHPDGYIVTNAHVVARTNEQRVMFAGGQEYEAQVVAADTTRDLAVLKIDAPMPLPTLTLGRSDDLMIGETVIAIGNPLGFQHTVTSGVVSAVNREIAISPQVAFHDLIQTDASINPGNSGGPLLNVNGELIGVNTAIRGDAQNIGFAIPVDDLRAVLPELLDVERRYRIETGLDVNGGRTPRVAAVRPGSPAAEAGIEVGDELVEVNGAPVRESIDLDIALINRRPGEAIELKVVRGGAELTRTLQLAARPAPDGGRLAAQKLGLSVYPLPEDIARELRLRRASGVLVTQVEPGGPGDRAGIERRDILLALGQHYVATVDDLGRLLEALDRGDVVPVSVLRVERLGKVKRSGPIQVR